VLVGKYTEYTGWQGLVPRWKGDFSVLIVSVLNC